jgi:hypothetical protein
VLDPPPAAQPRYITGELDGMRWLVAHR